jgi:predicted ABC-type ATPase
VAPFSPEAVAFRAGRLILKEISLCVKRGEDFGFETTLSARSLSGLDSSSQETRIQGTFLLSDGAETVDLALTRVRGRVLEGGHDIPDSVVRRRFDRSIQDFLAYYCKLGDSWILFDNSGATPTVVAFEKQGSPRIIN